MALSRVKVWAAEVLTFADLNTEFNNVLNNPVSLISPLTAAIDMNGFELILDVNADTSITADADDRIDFRISALDQVVWGVTEMAFNEQGADINFRIESDTNINGFFLDAGLFTGVGAIGLAAAATNAAVVLIDNPALTATAATNIAKLRIENTAAITVPAGVTALAASLSVDEPNLTATGTITTAATVYIEAAPTEGGTNNYALFVDAGAVKFDGTLTVDGNVTIASALTGVIRADSGLLSVDSDVTDIVSAASTILAGKVELLTQAEYDAGTDTTRAPTASLNKLTLGTPIATTSGTAHDFTGIPAGTRRITLSFAGVSLSGVSDFLVQLGDLGGFETTGYISSSGEIVDAGATTIASATTGFIIISKEAAKINSGHFILTLLNSATFKWVSSHQFKTTTLKTASGGGDKTLSAELTQIRLTTLNGTDTFDAGEVNIIYER